MIEKIIERRKEFVKLWKEECDEQRATFYKGYACALNWVEGLIAEVNNEQTRNVSSN